MSSRPPVFTWNEELHFGPPSEPIHILTLIDEAQKLHLCGLSPWLVSESADPATGDACNAISGWKEWQGLSDEARASVEADCDLDDMQSALLAILTSQKHISYLQKTQASAVTEVTATQPSGKKKGKEKAKKPAAERDETELEPLKQAIEQTPLKMWKLKPAAKPYIRSGHVSDQNALDTLQPKQGPSAGATPILCHEVLITFTVYTRNSWYPFAFSRNSQHVLPSLHTLADVWDCIPCALKGDGAMPREVTEIDAEIDAFNHPETLRKTRVIGYDLGDDTSDQDSVVMVVEDVAYSDGRCSPDYADKLLSHLNALRPPPPSPDAPPPLPLGPYERPTRSTPLQKGPPFHAVALRSLTIRVNEPYWILHRGNCEHWFVIDEIRYKNPRDPPSGYPITLQRTPIFRPLCRICSKVPATISILNDVRLGESPAMLCRPCWELFGGSPQPKEDDDPDARIVVVPMVIKTS